MTPRPKIAIFFSDGRHLKRYLAEFDFRYNERAALGVNDPMRMEAALMGILGKRLTYRDSSIDAAI